MSKIIKLIRSFFLVDGHICPWWLAYTFDNPVRRFFHQPEHLFAPYLKPGMTIVDIGCGMGYFSIGMAKIVGSNGKIISVDLQQKMLDVLEKRAERAGFAARIFPRLCKTDDINVSEHVDFALAFWMVHEIENKEIFFKQVFDILNPGATFLISEPKFHVSVENLNESLKIAREIGFSVSYVSGIRFSFAAVLTKDKITSKKL